MSSTTLSTSMLGDIKVAAALAGLLSHSLIFIRGEHHLKAPMYLQLGLVVSCGLFAVRARAGYESALMDTLSAIACYLVALFTSMFVYRLVFHPLRSFPGPFMWRVTKLWHVMKVSATQQNYRLLDKVHDQYGDFVRTGPSEVTVFHPGVFDAIGGAGTPCIKAPWYDMLYPMIAINSVRQKDGYAHRRRVWDSALNMKAIKGEKQVVMKALHKLASAMEEYEGQVINVTEWMSYFTFDTMGELAFNKSFGMLDKHEWSGKVKLLRNGLGILAYVTPAPWMAHVAFTFLPKSRLLWQALVAFAKDMMGDRLDKDSAKKDVSYWMIEAERRRNEGEEINLNNLYGDAFAMIVAGSHTVATTLIFALLELAKNKETQERVRRELGPREWYDSEAQAEMEFLNAFVSETMRLYPVVPTGGIRMTQAEGVMIGDTFIPPQTTIVAPRYTLSRLESCFERATEFVPERWLSRPEMIKDKRAFNPFNNGRHSCPGKNLGLMEVRMCIAVLVKQFDISLSKGETGADVQAQMTDSFTANPGPLRLVFKKLEA